MFNFLSTSIHIKDVQQDIQIPATNQTITQSLTLDSTSYNSNKLNTTTNTKLTLLQSIFVRDLELNTLIYNSACNAKVNITDTQINNFKTSSLQNY
jgi:hypothetical protein